MPTDTAPFDVTVPIAAPVPVVTSGEEAIKAAVDTAITQVLRGHFPLVDVLSVPGSHDPAAWKYHHVGNHLLNDVLPPNHGQI
jgi:hypothetical protein